MPSLAKDNGDTTKPAGALPPPPKPAPPKAEDRKKAEPPPKKAEAAKEHGKTGARSAEKAAKGAGSRAGRHAPAPHAKPVHGSAKRAGHRGRR